MAGPWPEAPKTRWSWWICRFCLIRLPVYDAVVNAGRIMKETHCGAVKLEGGAVVCPQIKAIVDASIPVCAHLGLTPQSINAFGGFKVQGKTVEAAQKLIDDAKAVEEAAPSLWCWNVFRRSWRNWFPRQCPSRPSVSARGTDATARLLVYADMLAMFSDFCPKFVRKFANVGDSMRQAFSGL